MRRCASLRRALFKGLESLLSHTFSAYQDLKPLVVEADLDKYYDIYEITRTDKEDTERFSRTESFESGDTESLNCLKLGLKKLHTMRSYFFVGFLPWRQMVEGQTSQGGQLRSRR